MRVPDIKINNGHTIPQVGLGVWQVRDQTEFNAAFETALKAGYNHIDTAQAYDNEHYLGEAMKEHGIKRQDIFITTKIKVQNFRPKHVQDSFAESLQKLKTDYVDLLLLHFPVTILRKKAWLELEKIQAIGGARSIGVSNYTIKHLEDLQKYASVTPAINQVELHIFLQQPELIDYCRKHGIVIEAYSPLAHSREMDNQTVQTIADKYGRSYAQIMLRWLVEKDLVILPKSVTPKRIIENINVFDFELDQDDLDKLAALDKDMRTCWSPVHVP